MHHPMAANIRHGVNIIILAANRDHGLIKKSKAHIIANIGKLVTASSANPLTLEQRSISSWKILGDTHISFGIAVSDTNGFAESSLKAASVVAYICE